MDRRKKIIMSVSRFLADPAAWWEKRKWVIALGVVTVTLLHSLIGMGIIDLRATFVWLAIWTKPLTGLFLF